MTHIYVRRKSNRELLESILEIVKCSTMKEGEIMGLVEDIKAQQEATKAGLQGIQSDVGNLTAQIADLKAQVASGGVATVADLQSILDNATAIANTVRAVDDSVPPPDPVPAA